MIHNRLAAVPGLTAPASRLRTIGRRVFLTDLGRGTMLVAAVGFVAACGGDDDDGDGAATAAATDSPTSTASPAITPTETATATGTATEAPTATPTEAPAPDTSGAVEWERVNLGFVSAYVLVRNGEAATVDTGVRGSEAMIEASLAAVGLAWDNVGHVIVTHAHPDHQGSLTAVLEAAPDATAYAGAADIPSLTSPRAPQAVGNGDSVFGLDIIETPGHTPGHIAVLDPISGLLVAGDSLNGAGGGVIGPNPQFSSDHAQALESVGVLATLEYDTVLFGHGEPVVGNASTLVGELAASL
jgi:glyoxylase-like metal-dependent hydrolase (beta-lactamase superfamily II)